jgi:Na+/phosphate symporter
MEKALEMKKNTRSTEALHLNLKSSIMNGLKQEDQDTLMSSKTHLELMAMLRNISSHATNIAHLLVQWDLPEGRVE